uniref:peptide-methionine (S)-S-oxide reductase MsrA n=1 Tax=Thaumasiovibrio occultus TaxID=1891184 RepID=UPI000B35B78A|nr:peptide-methionine (S)-S-oxide reductase MsrA [Thaumasiovibrio occultus]
MSLKTELVAHELAHKGRETPIFTPQQHTVLGQQMLLPSDHTWPSIVVGMGCFWGAERKFWQQTGVVSTAVGYSGGYTPNPTYDEVCSGRTGHTEVVLVHFDPSVVSLTQLLKVFWENHDPTQGMRQGNDRGTQYRSAIYTQNESHYATALESQVAYQAALAGQGGAAITTEIAPLDAFYFAEAYHQQYLDKNPGGYCGIGGTGICYPE